MSRADALIEASDGDETLLLGMIQYKGARGRRSLLVIEGHDDVTFVDAVLARFNPAARPTSTLFNAKGKQNVLTLFDLVTESLELEPDEYWFFIDADFDGLRGRVPNGRIWMTPTYSFENLLVSSEVLEAILTGEFRCNDVGGAEDLQRITEQYQAFIESYEDVMLFPNLCAYYCVQTKTKNHPHDEIITNAITVAFPKVVLALSEDELLKKMPKAQPLKRATVESYKAAFSALDPLADWRGKFLYAAFVSFLDELKKDRGTKNPKYFAKKQSMTFNPRTDAIRALTSVAVLPNSLKAFVQTIPG